MDSLRKTKLMPYVLPVICPSRTHVIESVVFNVVVLGGDCVCVCVPDVNIDGLSQLCLYLIF